MEKHQTVCPPWVGKLMVSPLRKWFHNPVEILTPHVHAGFKVLEIGPGMGFFSIPLAQLTGKNGKVYCIDIQETMLTALDKRAKKFMVANQIITHHCNSNSLNIEHLNESIDFALLFAVVHEIPNQQKLFEECFAALKSGGKVLFAEPKGHVKPADWEKSIQLASKAGFIIEKTNYIRGSISILLIKA